MCLCVFIKKKKKKKEAETEGSITLKALAWECSCHRWCLEVPWQLAHSLCLHVALLCVPVRFVCVCVCLCPNMPLVPAGSCHLLRLCGGSGKRSPWGVPHVSASFYVSARPAAGVRPAGVCCSASRMPPKSCLLWSISLACFHLDAVFPSVSFPVINSDPNLVDSSHAGQQGAIDTLKIRSKSFFVCNKIITCSAKRHVYVF